MSPSKTIENAQKSMTVVLPVAKVSPNLLRAVYSVLGQVYLDFKLLVVYHPGTADSVAPVQELQNQRIEFYRSQHCHLAGLLKDGLSQTHTDWVAMIEPDDIWLGDKLEKEIELLTQADETTVALYSGYYVIDDNDQLLFRSPSISKSGDVLDTVIDSVELIRPGALMASKEALSNVLNSLPSANLRVLTVALAHQGAMVSSGKRYMLTRNDERLTGANREADAIIEQEDAAVEVLKPYLVRKQWRRYKNIQLRAYMYHYLLDGRLNDASVLFPKIHHSLFDNFFGKIAVESLKRSKNFFRPVYETKLNLSKYARWPMWFMMTRLVYELDMYNPAEQKSSNESMLATAFGGGDSLL